MAASLMVWASIARRNCLRFDSTRVRVSQSAKPRFKTWPADCLLGLGSGPSPPFVARSRLAPPQRVLNAWTSQFKRVREGDSSTFKRPAGRTFQLFLAGSRDGRIGRPGRRFFETVTIMFYTASWRPIRIICAAPTGYSIYRYNRARSCCDEHKGAL